MNVLHIMEQYDELEVKHNTFADAIRDQAFEQSQGQIASARVPPNRFASKTLYWTLSGDDFGLDINRIVHTESAKLDKKTPEGEEIPPLF